MNSYESYKIIIQKKAQKFLERLTRQEREKIVSKIQDLRSSRIQALNIKKLQGYKNLYRIRVDNHRVVFAAITKKQTIIILVIGHRREVYDILRRVSF